MVFRSLAAKDASGSIIEEVSNVGGDFFIAMLLENDNRSDHLDRLGSLEAFRATASRISTYFRVPKGGLFPRPDLNPNSLVLKFDYTVFEPFRH